MASKPASPSLVAVRCCAGSAGKWGRCTSRRHRAAAGMDATAGRPGAGPLRRPASPAPAPVGGARRLSPSRGGWPRKGHPGGRTPPPLTCLEAERGAGAARGARHRARRGLKAVIVAGRPSPARGASPWQRGASRSRLPGRRQEAVRAGGFWETAGIGVSASAADRGAAALPEPEVCAGVREGLRGAGRGAAGRGRSRRRTAAGPSSGPGGAGRRLRAPQLRRGGWPEGREGLCALRRSFPASSATPAFPLPH